LVSQKVKNFISDRTVLISTEETATDVILQISSLDKGLTEEVTLSVYDRENNLKKVIQSQKMQRGFVSLIASIRPNTLYFIEVASDISYTATVSSASTNVHISPRFGDEQFWDSVGSKMVRIEAECASHCVAKTFVLFNVHIEVESDECRVLLHSYFSDAVLANSVVLFCVNLDDNTKQFIPNLDLSTFRIPNNEHGYALIAFSRPSQRIARSKYDIKILFEGVMEHRMIDMASTVDFRVGYVHNFENSLLRDEITSDDGAKFVFLELQFDTKEECGAFGKIVEFIDTESKAVMATYSSTQSVMFIAQMRLAEDRKLTMCVRIDKDRCGSNPEALFKDGSIDCSVRIISDAKIRLFPDNSQTVQFDAIKSEWHAQKGRAEKAKEALQKYLAKRKEIFELTTENISPRNQSQLKRLEIGDKSSIVADDEFWQNDKEKSERETAENKQEIADEKKFRSAQTEKFAEHNAMIDETLRASHENTKNYDAEDVTKRGQLRAERLEWTAQLTKMADLDEEMKRNMADLKQRLTTFSDEIETMVDEARNTELRRFAKGVNSTRVRVAETEAIRSKSLFLHHGALCYDQRLLWTRYEQCPISNV